MIATTYTCDRCGKTQDSPKDMYMVGVSVREFTSVPQYNQYITLKPKALWCRDCVEGIGLLVPSPKPKEPVNSTTLEDIVVELIQEELEAHQ